MSEKVSDETHAGPDGWDTLYYNISAGNPDLVRPLPSAFPPSSRLSRLLLLADSGVLGTNEQAKVILLGELRNVVESGTATTELTDLLRFVDSQDHSAENTD